MRGKNTKNIKIYQNVNRKKYMHFNYTYRLRYISLLRDYLKKIRMAMKFLGNFTRSKMREVSF